MDLNGDGILDIISGGYPGELYLFEGRKDGIFAERREIRNREGVIVNVGKASVPFASDWDRDGDLDLLVGTIHGEIVLIPNESGSKALMLGQSSKIEVQAVAYRADSRDTGPHVADWDGDGNHDLILGVGDGSVLFFRNTTSGGMPVLAPPVELVPKNDQMAQMQPGYDPTKDLGYRSKAWVGDWNNDGRPDLIMGVFLTLSEPAAEFTPDMEREKERTEEQYQEIYERYQDLNLKVQDEVLAEMGVERGVRLSQEQLEEFRNKIQEALPEAEGYEELVLELNKINTLLGEFRARRVPHGWVWVFLRK